MYTFKELNIQTTIDINTLLTPLTSFIIMSIMAAFDNDWSGILFIGKVIGFIAFMIVFGLIFCQK